ncbi:MAG: hypothetical protein QG639_861 [Patescibacteria group bacterium]|nr:hypothetical protein [Patescibacteria group bacterium]
MRKLYEFPTVPATEAEKAMTATLAAVLLAATQKGQELAKQGKTDLEIAPVIAELIRDQAPFVQILITGGIVQIAFAEHDALHPLFPQKKETTAAEYPIHMA